MDTIISPCFLSGQTQGCLLRSEEDSRSMKIFTVNSEPPSPFLHYILHLN
uniref:Uncharacterized protein n=1 Tax=Meloidogyne enterolobii TaxID=390850 RepID=A0A6V7UH77_MELEN|nr:unnamed protein product [Meloidogyne enterolobii]